MRIKRGANIQGLHISMRAVLRLYSQIWDIHGYPAAVTSGMDGNHTAGSLHPHGRAVDLRTWRNDYGLQMDAETKAAMAGLLRLQLAEISPHYEVHIAKTHLHVEYDNGRFGRGWSELD